LPGRPIKKTAVQADFIRCHPWRSPFGPAEAVQIFSRKICGKDVLISSLLLRQEGMMLQSYLVWRMSI
jgi:hypothetical protein